MRIVTINNHPEYFNQVTTYLYQEWKEDYQNIYGCHNLKDMRDLYNYFYNMGAVTYVYTSQQGVFVGCYTLMKIKGNTYLCDVFIKPDLRHRGLGKRLVKDGTSRGLKQASKIYISVSPHLVSFYMKLGYTFDRMTEDKKIILVTSLSSSILYTHIGPGILLVIVVALVFVMSSRI